MLARGPILDLGRGALVATPFPKFFAALTAQLGTWVARRYEYAEVDDIDLDQYLVIHQDFALPAEVKGMLDSHPWPGYHGQCGLCWPWSGWQRVL